MKTLFLTALLAILCACQGYEEEGSLRLASRSQSLSAEKRKALLPNELFTALADQKGEEELWDIIEERGDYLFVYNDEGDSALGLAIKFSNFQGALFVARQLSPEHYFHQNHKGEGYVYLASQKGYVELIRLLAHRYYEYDDLFSDYEFTDLDMTTNEGERALHVAKNQAVAEALESEYWRGWAEFPLRKFTFFENNKGQVFLHTAVRDQNADLLRWGVKKACALGDEVANEDFFGRIGSYLWRGAQFHTKFIGMDWDDLINTEDNEGLSPVNLSAQKLFFEGMRILSACRWTDWRLKDEKGNIPLQNFLLALDPLEPTHGLEVKEAFILIMESRTRLSKLSIRDHINSMNEKGETSLHISAQLADPFFYNSLKKYGDIDQSNLEGRTAREIFSARRGELNVEGENEN